VFARLAASCIELRTCRDQLIARALCFDGPTLPLFLCVVHLALGAFDRGSCRALLARTCSGELSKGSIDTRAFAVEPR
jgi:hypothetical protein